MNVEELNQMTEQALKNSNKAISFEYAKKGHFLSEEFLKKEIPTMDEYNAIMNYFDKAIEYNPDDFHAYFEKIYFIINTNTDTSLITVENVEKILLMYENFMNKIIELANDEEKEELKQIYENDKQYIKDTIEERRSNYPSIHEEITYLECTKCFRTIPADSQFCKYCGNEVSY